MIRRLLGTLLLSVFVLGAFAAFVPAPVEARDCVICPQIGILCGTCYTLVPQNCNRCAYCKRIPGCQP